MELWNDARTLRKSDVIDKRFLKIIVFTCRNFVRSNLKFVVAALNLKPKDAIYTTDKSDCDARDDATKNHSWYQENFEAHNIQSLEFP